MTTTERCFALDTVSVRVTASPGSLLTDLAPLLPHVTDGAPAIQYDLREEDATFVLRRDGQVLHTSPDPLDLGPILQLNLTREALWARRGWLSLHGSATTSDGGGVLCLGASGAGKSSLALALVAGGHRLLTDDTALLSPDGVVTGLPFAVRFDPELDAPAGLLSALPAGFESSFVRYRDEQDRVVRSRVVVPPVDRVGRPVPLRVLVCLARGATPRVERLTTGEAVAAVWSHRNHAFDHDDPAEQARRLPALLRDVRAYRVVSSTAGEAVDAVRGLLRPKQSRELACKRIHQSWQEGLLDEALRALQSARVRVAPLKGPFLAARLYPERGARGPSADLDLLVAERDLTPSLQALQTIGYHPPDSDDINEDYYRKHHHHLHLLRGENPMIELHFRASTAFGLRLRSEELLARATESHTAGGARAWVLAPEDELIYLSVHAAGHLFALPMWLRDIDMLLRNHPDLSWPVVVDRAQALGAGAVLALTLEVLRERLDLAVPRPASLGLPPASALRIRLAQRLLRLHPQLAEGGAPRTLAHLTFGSLLAGDAGSARRYLSHHLRRVTRRRLQRALPRIVPEEWSH